MRFRQVEHFLHAVAHAQPEKTAAAQRVERLHQLIAGVQRILEGIEEGQQAAHAVWGHHDQHGGGAQSQPECQKEIEKTRSANQAHEEQQRNHDHGSAEVGLKQEQAADNPGHGKGRNDALDEGLYQLLLGAHEIGKIQHQGDAREFHGLQGKAPDRNPAARAVDPEAERRNTGQQQEKGKKKRGIGQTVDDAAGQPRGGDQRYAPCAREDELPLEKQVLVSGQPLADDAAGGKNHEQADAQQRKHHGRQPPVHGAHGLGFRPARAGPGGIPGGGA